MAQYHSWKGVKLETNFTEILRMYFKEGKIHKVIRINNEETIRADAFFLEILLS